MERVCGRTRIGGQALPVPPPERGSMRAMNAVTRGLILPVIDLVRGKGFACLHLFDGLAYDEATLRTRQRRLPWADFVLIHDRLTTEVGGADALSEIVSGLETPDVDWLLRMLGTPAALYRFLALLSPAVWGTLELWVEELGPNRLRLGMRTPPDAAPGEPYFRVAPGFVASLPARLGGGPAVLAVESMGPHEVRWIVELPATTERTGSPPPEVPKLGLFEELSSLGEDLVSTLRGLRAAREELAATRRTVETVWSIGEQLARDAEPGSAAPLAGQLLRAVPGLRALRATRAADGTSPAKVVVEVGEARDGWRRHPVVRNGRVLGSVEASPPEAAGLDIAGLLAPWFALAWSNGVSPAHQAGGGALFVVGPEGDVVWSNGEARAWLAARGDGATRLRGALTASDPTFDVQPLDHPQGHYVVALLNDARGIAERVSTAVHAWGLTRTQGEVLEALVRGLTNKEIAAELGNAEATIESHVTRIMRKAGVSGRTALVSRFWAGSWSA